MKLAWVIARNDLRLFLKNKAAYFWLFGSPLLFAFFMGAANRGPGNPANAKPSVAIENLDTGFVSRLFVEELGLQGLDVLKDTYDAARGIRIPADFTSRVLAHQPATAEVFRVSGSGDDLAALVELRVLRAVVALNGHLVEQAVEPGPPSEERLVAVREKPDPVQVNASFGTRKPIPAGYRQSLPGVLVMFTLMNLLIFGGATVASERREGVLRRLLALPLSRRDLVAGKVVGLMLLGAVQIGVLLTVAAAFMNLAVAGNLLEIVLLMMIYAWMAASLGVLIGSLITSEDKVVAVCVLASIAMAALGGCWWPLEIVPENVRTLGYLFPTAWAMDALHQLISFGGSLVHITRHLFILAAAALAASFLAMRFFRVS